MYFPGLDLDDDQEPYGQDIPRILHPLVKAGRAIKPAFTELPDAIARGLSYPFERAPVDYGQLADDTPQAPPPAPKPEPDIPKYGSEIPDAGEPDVADEYLSRTAGGGDSDSYVDRLTGGGGRVSVTLGGKSYDYGAGERIPQMHRGGYGGGNLAAMQPGGVVPGREPSQISPQGMVEEERRGGSGVSMMQKLDGVTLPSELEEGRDRAVMARLRAAESDPFGIEQFRQRSEIEERLRSASAHAKGEEDRRTADARGSQYQADMERAYAQYQAAQDRLKALKPSMDPQEWSDKESRIEQMWNHQRGIVMDKYGVKRPDPNAISLSGG